MASCLPLRDRDETRPGFFNRATSRRALLRGAALGAVGIGASLYASGASAGTGARGGGMNGLPSARKMMSWIREIVGHGIRRPGYAADRWVERWAADPYGRHQWRYLDGNRWTDQVADGSTQSIDPAQ